MGNIKVMDTLLANKIAAGEVVEKVSSVVKELTENSIDAKSKNIKIELTLSGTKEIKITDDGIGMDKEDAVTAFTPHATSKIKNENDLYFINTLGFRGEALASIQSVSDVTLHTCNNKEATLVHIKGGELLSVENEGRNQGTTISVKNLFYNTPARLKFLKSLSTELNNVVVLVTKLALSHPDISFSLYNNDKEVLKTTGSGDLLKVIHEIYGYNTSKNMIYIEGENFDYEVSGYISNINISRSNRNNMITLVNSRIVNNNYLNKIIKDAYHTVLAENKYPIVVININTDPTLVDVNIHPTKQDIKFSKIDSLKELLYSLIKNSLYKADNKYKAYVETDHKDETNIIANTYKVNEEIKSLHEDISYNNSLYDNLEINSLYTNNYLESQNKEQIKIDFETKENNNDILIHPVGLAMGTYLFANDEDNVYIIDIHAANERINYERFMNKLKEEEVSTVSLLIPLTIEYNKSEYDIILENKGNLNSLGITIEEFGINTIRVTSHPTWLKRGYEEESIRKILDLIISLNSNFDRVKFNEKAAIMLSCKMSVKANTCISYDEQYNLIQRLFKCEFPYTCPHGRPTIIKYTNYELEKMFKRVV